MTIATRLDQYLTDHNIHFQTVNHSHSHSSLQSGVSAGIPLMNLAKAVILEDHEGHHMMAVLPATIKSACLDSTMSSTLLSIWLKKAWFIDFLPTVNMVRFRQLEALITWQRCAMKD